MIAATALASVKTRLDIADTTWDTAINDFVAMAVKRLYPVAQLEVAVQTVALTVDNYGEAQVNMASMSTPILAARKVEVSGGYGWSESNDNYHHGTTLFVRSLNSGTMQARIYGVTTFTLPTVPEHLELAVIWYAMGEFYDFLAGNKRQYNVYMQGGARAVENMRDEADFYERKANVYLNDRATIYGVS